ncbi:MAG: hypothetical protein AAF689_12620 [Pseudomonadota bacterium]
MTEKPKKERSPSFPFIALPEAVKRLEAFEQTFGRHPTPAAKAGLAWGLKDGSSQAAQLLAALKAFGFVEYSGTAKDRTAYLTDRARTYLRAQQQHIKDGVLREAALEPKQFQKFWAIWGADRPPDPICLDELILKHAFTDSAANTFLKVYDNTIEYSGLSDADAGPSDQQDEESREGDGNDEIDTSPSPKFSEGALINWESGGQVQWAAPRRVTSIDQHEDGSFYYKVQGPPEDIDAGGWVPEAEAIAGDVLPAKRSGFAPPPPVAPTGPAADPEPQAGQRKAVFPVSEGDVVFLFPEGISLDGLEELEDYLAVFLKKEKRLAAEQ